MKKKNKNILRNNNFIKLFFLFLSMFLALVIFSELTKAQLNATVCCERTRSGAFCQNVPSEACDPNSRQVPTSCDSTSYCKTGTCYDSNEGTCLDNTPQLVCNANGGIWSETKPPQCELGCCILGNQAAFVSLVRCKRLSEFLGLKTNYDKTIRSEMACIAAVQGQDRGACVYEFEFQRTCKFTTREECQTNAPGSDRSAVKGQFFKNKLCSAEELGTICGPTTKTTCVPGKDEVYFVDSCGNPANIYDSSKINNKDYWTNVKRKEESCNPNAANAGSSSCGNCNYLLGSYCRASSVAGIRASPNSFVCADLNCIDESGKKRLHGESWCLADENKRGKNTNPVGSRFYRRICMNGQVTTEPCSDFRAEECVEDKIQTESVSFSQSACRVNRWQDCLAQTDRIDCENEDRRDCFWKEGVTLGNNTIGAVCLPKNSPGLAFWKSEESRVVCGVGNKICVVKFEKGLIGGEEKCKENCECLTPGWEAKYGEVCSALGDCGAKINYIGKSGFRNNLRIKIDGKDRTK